MKDRRTLVVFAVAASGMALAFSSCSRGTDDQGLDTLAAISFIDGAELHAVDTAINAEKTIPADAQAKAAKLESVMAGANWPEDLEDEAEVVEAAVRELAEILDAEAPDMVKAGAVAKKAHETSHDFSGLVWSHLREEAGLKVEEGAGHD